MQSFSFCKENKGSTTTTTTTTNKGSTTTIWPFVFLPLIYIAIMITLIILDFMILPLLFTSQLDFASSQRKGQNRGDL